MAGYYLYTNDNQTTFTITNLATILYSIVVRLYGLVIRISAVNSAKARQWLVGRKGWRAQLKLKIQAFESDKKIWFHCASYGEFEQGRPIMEAIKKLHPNDKLVLSFFSPSGYEAFKDWKGADVIVYLPLDTKKNAKDFISIVNPSTVIFIKYEFWLHFLNQLKAKHIPTYLVSAVFKEHHPFFKWYGGIFKQTLLVFSKLFVQDQASAKLLQSIQMKHVEVVGDTRFDRVLAIKDIPFENEFIKEFKQNKKLIIAGSTWSGDEEFVLKAFKKIKDKGVKLLIAPHEIESRFIINLIKKINEIGLSYSLYTNDPSPDVEVLILDTIGLLSKLYKYADCAYVGGGFNDGLHNVLEPTVNFIPVSFYGENFHKYNEAMELLALLVAQKATTTKELKDIFKQQLFDETYLLMVKEKAKQYFIENGQVTEKVLRSMQL